MVSRMGRRHVAQRTSAPADAQETCIYVCSLTGPLDCASTLYSPTSHLHVMDCARMGRRHVAQLPLAPDAQGTLRSMCVPSLVTGLCTQPYSSVFKTHLHVMDARMGRRHVLAAASSTSRLKETCALYCVPSLVTGLCASPIFCFKTHLHVMDCARGTPPRRAASASSTSRRSKDIYVCVPHWSLDWLSLC
jgi:hypothetical protein